MIVCERCGRDGGRGPLLRIGRKGRDAKYRHKICQLHSEPTSGEIPNMPMHSRPKLWVAQIRPPNLKDAHGRAY